MTDLTGAVAALAGVPLAEQDLPSMLDRVCHITKDLLEPATEVSVTLVERDRARTVAATGAVARDLDEVQYAQEGGPCVDGSVSGTHTLITDMRREERWPDYAPVAVERGVLSSLGVPVPIQQELVATINVYATEAGAFEQPDLVLAEEFAAYVGIAIANMTSIVSNQETAEGLRTAMQSRAVIEQAKGILMGAHRVSADQAFDLLVALSQTSNRKLRDVAQGLVDQVPAQS